MSMDKETKQMWQDFRNATTETILEQVKEVGIDNDTVKALLRKAISRTIDERFAKQDDKETAVSNQPDLSLDDLANTGKQSRKQHFVEQLASKTGLPQSVFANTSTKELEAALAQYE